MTGGLFNTTYCIDLCEDYDGDHRVILRVGPVNRHLLMPFEHYLMQAETVVYERCEQVGVPVSHVLAMDTTKTLIDRDFMLVRYIPSSPMIHAKLSREDGDRISYEIGKATAKMHTLTEKKFGRVADVAAGKGFDRWSECMMDELEQWESVASSAGILTDDERAQVRALFRRAASVLDEICEPHLAHTDLWMGNILIRNDTPRPEFGAIIDADRAIWGDSECEFCSTTAAWTHENYPAFWEGYGRELPQDKRSVIRRGIYNLLRKLQDAYVFLIEYDMPENCEEQCAIARAQMETLETLL